MKTIEEIDAFIDDADAARDQTIIDYMTPIVWAEFERVCKNSGGRLG